MSTETERNDLMRLVKASANRRLREEMLATGGANSLLTRLNVALGLPISVLQAKWEPLSVDKSAEFGLKLDVQDKLVRAILLDLGLLERANEIVIEAMAEVMVEHRRGAPLAMKVVLEQALGLDDD